MGENNDPDPDIELSTRDIDRISVGNRGSVSYHSTRGKYGPKSRSGEITRVETLENGRVRFQLYDDERERDVEVTIGSTIGESEVCSRKAERWIPLGPPLRVSVFEDADSQEEASNTAITEFSEGRHESVVVAANVRWNSSILDWFEWSNRNA